MFYIKDVFKMSKGVQHPCRGLFLRFYFLKLFREKIKEMDEQYIEENKIQILEHLITNFRDMNSLWIRINSLIEDKETRKQ